MPKDNSLDPLNPLLIYAGVQDRYGSAAKENNDNKYGHAVASAFGYSPSELATAPSESNLGLSCGNPFVIANLREGETVVDLGSGAGFDVFQAAKKVGREGKVWGVDMNDVSQLKLAVEHPTDSQSYVKLMMGPKIRICSRAPMSSSRKSTLRIHHS